MPVVSSSADSDRSESPREPREDAVGDVMHDPLPERGRLPSEREVLRVLWGSPGEYLVRSEIHRRMPQDQRPTLGRVGQILTSLNKDQLLESVKRPAQGTSMAAFYQLSERGVALCHRLEFKRRERSLFPVTQEVLRHTLTRERLTRQPAAPGRIAAVYAYRGGLGRTTMVAHVARGLAENLGEGEQVLAVDLDFGAPGLDPFFNPHRQSTCRGLGGLVVDFQRKPRRKRHLWLRSALVSPEYVQRPLEEVPNLSFLPSGLSPGQDALSGTERAEALALLRAEVGLAESTGHSEPGSEPLKFLNELRAALVGRYRKTVIDSQDGRCLSSLIATQVLADELVLCLRKSEVAPASLAGLQAVLASFLRRREEEGETDAGVVFVFPLSEPEGPDELDRWIDRHLVADADGPAEPPAYAAERLAYEPRLARQPESWSNTSFYATVIARLGGLDRGGAPALPSPALQALMDVLDPAKPLSRRSMAAGILSNAPLQELGRLLDWYLHEPSLHMATDATGEQLVENIVKSQARRLRSMLLRPGESP